MARRRERRWRRQAGFTLIEIMVVMVIIGLLMALVGPNLIGRSEKAKVQAATMQIERLGTVLDTYRLDTGRYPTSQEGLGALVQKPAGAERWDGPYLTKGLPKDPWDRPYLYRSPGDQGRLYDLYSLGADGAPGGQGNNRDVSSSGGDTG
jgi:general secretion pathway protein G